MLERAGMGRDGTGSAGECGLDVHVFDCAQTSAWEGRQRLFDSSWEDTSVACHQG